MHPVLWPFPPFQSWQHTATETVTHPGVIQSNLVISKSFLSYVCKVLLSMRGIRCTVPETKMWAYCAHCSTIPQALLPLGCVLSLAALNQLLRTGEYSQTELQCSHMAEQLQAAVQLADHEASGGGKTGDRQGPASAKPFPSS